ncbi:MAG: chloramphenicol acetyltransferase [Methanobrevibacter millerae]|uniref:Chloramphenicol acetyltransferase n=1 Tax=Methanobrevibacter millerae TaxID=230361 RepID=A0A8T3V8V9_9EURY|nr:CatA-like O-acetyltransferase [Methanobrevibacter millerae]MBE6504508.1 chloramphenicol acetyltransferase [Methanobrevibacter millerae]
MKKIDFDLKNNPFIDFQSSRYMMSARINVEKLWKFCKKNDYSFFIMSLGCLMNGVNSVPNLKKRIINDEAVEYDYLEGVSPIMNDELNLYREMRVKTPQEFEDIFEWHDYVRELSGEILGGENKGFELEMEKRDFTNIANFSCIPWVDFDSITSCTLNGRQIQPLITWGKVSDDYEMSVSITVSHIFVHGRDLAYFFENIQKEFNNF